MLAASARSSGSTEYQSEEGSLAAATDTRAAPPHRPARLQNARSQSP
jgi:hypothetical protein